MDLGHGGVEYVVDNGVVKLRADGNLKFGFVNTVLDVFHTIGASVDEALAQHLHTGGLDKDGQSAVTIHLLDVDTAQHIKVEHDVLAHAGDAFHLALEGAVVAALIHLLVLNEFITLDFVLKLLLGEEIVVHAMHFLATAGRVVADTEKASFSDSSCITRPIMVDFPEPEGADMIINLPCSIISILVPRYSVAVQLYVVGVLRAIGSHGKVATARLELVP